MYFWREFYNQAAPTYYFILMVQVSHKVDTQVLSCFPILSSLANSWNFLSAQLSVTLLLGTKGDEQIFSGQQKLDLFSVMIASSRARKTSVLVQSLRYSQSKMRAQVCISLITLLLLVSVSHISTLEQVDGSWSKSRRLLQGDKDRPAPRGFPPPAGNALFKPQRAPPSKRAWIPADPPPLKIPPPQP